MLLECIEDRTSLPGLKRAWGLLADAQKCPLLGYDWFLSCINWIHPNDAIKVFVLRDGNGDIVAIAPLVVIKRHSIPHLMSAGSVSLYEPGGVLYSDEQQLFQLIDGIASAGMPIILYRLFRTSSSERTTSALKLTARAIINRNIGLPSLYIELLDSWDDFLGNMSSRRKYDYRRAKKRSMASGELSFECITPTPENVDEVLMSAYAVESSGWKGENGSGILHKKHLHDFFTAYGRESSANGSLKIFFLRIDSQNISSQIAIQAYGKLWILKIGYDEKWSKHSPGAQLTMECIRYAIENRLSSYEFLGSAEEWVRVWADRQRDYQTLSVYPYSPYGLPVFALDAASRIRKFAVHRAKAATKRLLSLTN